MSGRPKEFDNLVQTSLLVEAEVLKRAKEIGNISDICRNALMNVIDDPVLRKKYDKFEKIDKKTKELIHKVYKEHKNIQGCLKIIRRQCGLSVGQMEFLNWFERYDKKVGD